MIFRHKKLNKKISFIYGFVNDRVYDMVMTLEYKKSITEIHAWLSKVQMSPYDFLAMWNFLKKNIKSTWIEFEVLPEHAKFYKKIFKSVDCKSKKTFDGFQSELLKVHRECELIVK